MNVEIYSKDEARRNLLEPYVQLFHDDPYHELDTNEEEMEEELSEVRRIRRRYADLAELRRARAIYQNYMIQLIEKYGGLQRFLIAQTLGNVHEYIPPEPQMRPSKKNRVLEKHGIYVSNVVKSNEAFIQKMKDQVCDLTDEEILSGKKMKKRTVQLFKDSLNTRKIFDMKKTRSIDYLEEYFKRRNNKSETKEWVDASLADYLTGDYVIPTKKADPNEVKYYRGQWLSQKDIDVYEFYEELDDLGWDGYKLLQESKDSIVYNKDRLTKLYKKKRKDEKKSKKKKSKKRTSMDDFIKSIGESNGYESFAEFEDDMENMSAQHVFGDGGEM